MSYEDLLDIARRALAKPRDPDRLDQADPELMSAFAEPIWEAARAWFDLQIEGAERVPDGPALVVANHDSGMSFFEAIGWGAAMHLQRPHERWFGLGHDGIVDMPGVGRAMVAVGTIRARPNLAAAALREGHKVVVFPGGNPEAFRPFSQRYKVDLAGRTGWARLAIRNGVPVQPVVFCGGHAGFIVLSEGRRVAKLLRADKLLRVETWPLWFGFPWGLVWGPFFHVPLPVPVRVRMLDPIPTAHLGAAAADDPAQVATFVAEVLRVMQAAMDELAAARATPWTDPEGDRRPAALLRRVRRGLRGLRGG
jgi:1-acyl-sn-glycerol-3-phosphate acyltransferase